MAFLTDVNSSIVSPEAVCNENTAMHGGQGGWRDTEGHVRVLWKRHLTSLLRPSPTMIRILLLFWWSAGLTSLGCTKAPSTTVPAAMPSICFLVGSSFTVATYSFVSPFDGCCIFWDQAPVSNHKARAFASRLPQKFLPAPTEALLC